MKNNAYSFRSATVLLCLTVLSVHAAPLVVVPSNDASVLAGSVLGSGLTVVGVPAYSGANIAAGGTFSGGLDLIGISSGLLLTTGDAAAAVGPNNTDSYSGVGATSSLRFDFTTAGGNLRLNYVFASEEHPFGFDDTFQLLIDGVNIAKVPGTTDDVSVATVNAVTNAPLFNDNPFGSAVVDLQYDGFTDVFSASADLAAGTHSIEFLISDVGDMFFDSAVFIAGASLTVKPVPPDGGGPAVPDGGSTLALVLAGAAGLALLRRRAPHA